MKTAIYAAFPTVLGICAAGHDIVRNGVANSNIICSGAASGGVTPSGAAQINVARNGVARNGVARNGVARNGVVHNGIAGILALHVGLEANRSKGCGTKHIHGINMLCAKSHKSHDGEVINKPTSLLVANSSAFVFCCYRSRKR